MSFYRIAVKLWFFILFLSCGVNLALYWLYEQAAVSSNLEVSSKLLALYTEFSYEHQRITSLFEQAEKIGDAEQFYELSKTYVDDSRELQYHLGILHRHFAAHAHFSADYTRLTDEIKNYNAIVISSLRKSSVDLASASAALEDMHKSYVSASWDFHKLLGAWDVVVQQQARAQSAQIHDHLFLALFLFSLSVLGFFVYLLKSIAQKRAAN